jgi:glycerate kinase
MAADALRLLIAPQSFKGSLSAQAVAAAIAEGVRLGGQGPSLPAMTLLPLADGGEGTMAALLAALGGTTTTHQVSGPLPGQRVSAEIGWLPTSPRTAIIEMAQAAGLPLVPPAERDPTQTTTLGVGELILLALAGGAERLWLTLGGSGTNDGGAGMAQALGVRLLDEAGQELPVGGGALARLARIDASQLDPRLATVELVGITDVTNPLCGPQGASAIYGPQKGATPEQVTALDDALARYATLVARDLAAVPGAGAAGGLGFGLLAFGGAGTRLARGADFVLDALRFDEQLATAQLVITGEGRLDEQVAFGKLTGTVANRARRRAVPVICVVGGLAAGYEAAYDLGVGAIIVASEGPRSLAGAMADAPRLITEAVARAWRLWRMAPP